MASSTGPPGMRKKSAFHSQGCNDVWRHSGIVVCLIAAGGGYYGIPNYLSQTVTSSIVTVEPVSEATLRNRDGRTAALAKVVQLQRRRWSNCSLTRASRSKRARCSPP